MSQSDKKTSSTRVFGADIPVKTKRKPKSVIFKTPESSNIQTKESICSYPKAIYKTRDGGLTSTYASTCHETYDITDNPNMEIHRDKETKLPTIDE